MLVMIVISANAAPSLAQTASVVQRRVRGRIHAQLGRCHLVFLEVGAHVVIQGHRTLVFSSMLVRS